MLLDDADTNSIIPSQFDMERISEIEIGEKIDLENGNASILRYKDSWVVLLNNHPKFNSYNEFKTKQEMLDFLHR